MYMATCERAQTEYRRIFHKTLFNQNNDEKTIIEKKRIDMRRDTDTVLARWRHKYNYVYYGLAKAKWNWTTQCIRSTAVVAEHWIKDNGRNTKFEQRYLQHANNIRRPVRINHAFWLHIDGLCPLCCYIICVTAHAVAFSHLVRCAWMREFMCACVNVK